MSKVADPLREYVDVINRIINLPHLTYVDETLCKRLLDLADQIDHEIEHVRKAEYARGYHDGQHSMDAEHYAVALKLRFLRFGDGSQENLNRLAYAIYPCATGWSRESCEGLRDKLVDLLGGVHLTD